ncbi:MAG: hypothetical protein AAAB19_24275 [Rhizobium sp.]
MARDLSEEIRAPLSLDLLLRGSAGGAISERHAVCGIHSSFVLGIGSRLMAEITKNFWDFSEPFLGFFLHIASIMMSTHALRTTR